MGNMGHRRVSRQMSMYGGYIEAEIEHMVFPLSGAQSVLWLTLTDRHCCTSKSTKVSNN